MKNKNKNNFLFIPEILLIFCIAMNIIDKLPFSIIWVVMFYLFIFNLGYTNSRCISLIKIHEIKHHLNLYNFKKKLKELDKILEKKISKN